MPKLLQTCAIIFLCLGCFFALFAAAPEQAPYLAVPLLLVAGVLVWKGLKNTLDEAAIHDVSDGLGLETEDRISKLQR